MGSRTSASTTDLFIFAAGLTAVNWLCRWWGIRSSLPTGTPNVALTATAATVFRDCLPGRNAGGSMKDVRTLATDNEAIMDADSIRLAHIVDHACLAVAYVLPVITVLRWNLIGVVIGTLVVWGSLAVAGPLISQLDPSRLEGGTAMLDVIWLLAGWIAGLLYCLLIYGSKRLVLYLLAVAISARSRRLATRRKANHESQS